MPAPRPPAAPKVSPKVSPKATAKGATKGTTKPRAQVASEAAPEAFDPLAELLTPPAPKKPGRKATDAKGKASKRRAAAAPPEPPARRNKAVANAAAAAYGKTVTGWSAAEITEAFSRFEAANPEPKGELDHSDPYTLLVAVVLSAQATDSGVNKATKGLFAAASTPAAMVALGEEKVAHFIRTLGLYKNKAKNVVELSRLLLERFHGDVPRDREALESLPGVGRKTANVVLNIAFGEPTIAVDTHLFRVANRTGLAPGATPLAVEEALEARIPDRFKLHAHHWLILHGRYICKARQPECGRCLIADLCLWPEKHF
ncbi:MULTISPECIES: endonuclease III [unclassified Xanthobacter]|uniref:endonuclease III n=1 Tax=unclassified Xanthobacter TaxID=2623496 RepID=UPI001EDFE368|nr:MULTISPECIES: endonuclease III [unclassified Xanthobacter]